eukprot:CAMPEP_0174829092 /NCGR_PEP_ID=MMETSP1114-20130205/1725_1 /TAXON_ID=312471 /ORGANISM="Neobodo designis, Strain CCAP 1951/1" /LENGTH=166 /DNA_ID=CAMNT_0016062835 /DNA_START=53 /DNA_END=553 /DNA_ORIENTATION=-
MGRWGGMRGGGRGGMRRGSSLHGSPRTHAPPTRTATRPMHTGAAPARVPHAPTRAGNGPGLMGIAGAAVLGSLAGNAIARQMFFSGLQPQSEEELKEMQPAMEISPCALQFDMYAKCMEANNNNVEACQWTWDYVAQCRTETARAVEEEEAAAQRGRGPTGGSSIF